jgi:dimethylglycine dehydrogenase
LVGRELRKSSLYDTLKEEGAQFAQIFGWERARWYDKSGKGEQFSFKRSNWFEAVRAEALAVRDGVGLMDLSTFSKFEVKGADAHSFLNRIFANKIPTKDGGIVLAHLLNDNGFIESEMTITRLGAEHFYVLSAAVAQNYDFDQLTWRKQASEAVTITDVTDHYGVLVLAGPKSRDVLHQCTDDATGKWLQGCLATVSGVHDVRLLRVNYVGELGWELHIPMAKMPTVYAALMKAGAAHGIKLFGTYAMNSLRMEKAYRGWGSELTNEIDMYEATMHRFIREDKDDFIGKAASLSLKQRGPRMTLVYLDVENTDSDCVGNEAVYHKGKVVGVTTSGAYGHKVQKSLAFAYVSPELAELGTELDIMMFTELRKARVIAESIWDPENLRLRA